MRQIKEVLRLKFEAKLSHERIAAGVSPFDSPPPDQITYRTCCL